MRLFMKESSICCNLMGLQCNMYLAHIGSEHVRCFKEETVRPLFSVRSKLKRKNKTDYSVFIQAKGQAEESE